MGRIKNYKMRILEKRYLTSFPFKWIDMEYYPNSNAKKDEIYLSEDTGNKAEELFELFYYLFGELKEELCIYHKSWWDFCLDSWDPKTDEYNYDLFDKSKETIDYFLILKNSEIEQGYSGSCQCSYWNEFLPVILECVISHIAPYSPFFYSEKYNFFFYFHHTGSIGFYHHEDGEIVDQIMNKARNKYLVS